jgi:hypothetical protein
MCILLCNHSSTNVALYDQLLELQSLKIVETGAVKYLNDLNDL